MRQRYKIIVLGNAEGKTKKTGRMAPSRCGIVLKACHTEALAECIYALNALANLDGLHGLLLLFNGHLRDDDVQDAVIDLGADLLFVDVFRQHHGLAEVLH